MKTGNLVLPVVDNAGRSLATVHAVLQGLLVDTFGGFTAMACVGAWRGPKGDIQHEPGTFYVFSGDELPPRLEADLMRVGALARQDAIYWQWDGVAKVAAVPNRVEVIT